MAKTNTTFLIRNPYTVLVYSIRHLIARNKLQLIKRRHPENWRVVNGVIDGKLRSVSFRWGNRELLQEAHEEDEELLSHERFAEALAFADAERHEVLSANDLARLLPLLELLGVAPLVGAQEVGGRVEAFGRRPNRRVVMHPVNIHEGDRVFFDVVAAHFALLNGAPRHRTDERGGALYFIKCRLSEAHPLAIGRSRHPVADGAFDLSLNALLHVRVSRHI